MPHLPQIYFIFKKAISIILKYLFVSVIVQNFKEVLRADLELLRIRSFGKSINITSMYP